MGRRRKGEVPAYRQHVSGQAFSVYQGHPHYFGRHGTAESRRRYKDFLVWWERQESTPPGAVRTLRDLVNAFMDFARGYYLDAAGQPTSQYSLYRTYLQPLLDGWADTAVDELRRSDLRQVQQQWARTLSRTTCNKALGLVKRVFRWGVKEEFVRPETLVGLLAVEGLPKGRSSAREHAPIQPVPEEDLERTLAATPRPFADMARVQLLVGCRPGELRRLRGDEINRQGVARLEGRTVKLAGGVWTFTPTQHKLKHKGKDLVYLIGPQAQALLAPYLVKTGDGYLFPSRQSPYYSKSAYHKRLRQAALAAGVTPWAANRLRHNALTRYDEAAGIQAASVIVGHAKVETTQVYAARNLQQAAELVARLG